MIRDYWGRRLVEEMSESGQGVHISDGQRGLVFERLRFWCWPALEEPSLGHFLWGVVESQPFRAGIILLGNVSESH